MTEKRYHKYVEELALTQPHLSLLPTLQRGFSPANVVYLTRLVLADTQNEKTEIPTITKGEGELYISASDKSLQMLEVTRRSLYTELYQTRKQFFDYPIDIPRHDIDRAGVSDAVQKIQKRIGLHRERTQHYIETGELQPVVTELDTEGGEKIDVPTTPTARKERQASLRSAISRAERELRFLVGKGIDSQDESVLKKGRLLTRLKINLKTINDAIAKDKALYE
jgi:hypothetical protein